MQPIYPEEKKGFVVFLCLVLLTACVFFSNINAPFLYGFLGMCWGGFGFFRLLYLMSGDENILTHALSLPAKLLFGLGQAQQNARIGILHRLGQADLIFWFVGGLLWMGWLSYCSVFPVELAVMQDFHLQHSVMLKDAFIYTPDYYTLAAGLSFYAMLGVVVFLAVTYACNARLLDAALYTLLPVFILGLLWFFLKNAMADNLLWPSFKGFKGSGVGQADVLVTLAPDLMSKSGSAFLSRYIEGGFIAAYGVYVLYVPILYKLVVAFWTKGSSMLMPATGILILFCLLALDIFWISAAMGQSLYMIGIAILALCWGASGRYQ